VRSVRARVQPESAGVARGFTTKHPTYLRTRLRFARPNISVPEPVKFYAERSLIDLSARITFNNPENGALCLQR